jgi:uncharacterized repeat protein (TIGR03803 family)
MKLAGVALSGFLLAAVSAHAATEKVVYEFKSGNNGASPLAGLIEIGGTFYGTAYQGGGSGCGGIGCGTVFSMTKAGKVKVLHVFTGGSDGASPLGGLIDVNGTLYGTTTGGGAYGDGTVFSVTTAGEETVVYSFMGGSDGRTPNGSLIDVGGTLYGATFLGGDANICDGGGCGTVFSVTPAGVEAVVYVFQGGSDASGADGSLINVNGTLYGTSQGGGGSANCTMGCGTVFSVTPGGSEQVVYAFQGGSDGMEPNAGLIDVNGTLYGTTFQGGYSGGQCFGGCGIVFSVTPEGDEQMLYAFRGGSTDGMWPDSSLISVGSKLYGTTYESTQLGAGTVFSVTPAGAEKVVFPFGLDGEDGANPEADLIEVGGKLYGTTTAGGGTGCGGVGCGTVYSVKP